MSVAESFSKV